MRVRGAQAFLLVAALFALAASAGEASRSPVSVKVMTRNLYLGANLDKILQAKTAQEAFAAAESAWADVQANNFPVRARAIAREIAVTKPDFVGLQEVTLYRTQVPADFTVTPARNVVLDYAHELRRALAARKLRYRLVGLGARTDAELPVGNPPAMDVRMTLHDAILVRIDPKIRIRRVRTGVYATTTPVFGGLLIARRGWVSVDATMAGRTFRVVNTHLEAFSDAVQVAQGQELADGPARTSLPTVLLGDLNSEADGSGTPTYANLLGAGFGDAWTQAHPSNVGLTCCHSADLREAGGLFYSRIDYVLVRKFRGVAAGIVGEEPRDRLGGLWPSDHAGLWVRLRLP